MTDTMGSRNIGGAVEMARQHFWTWGGEFFGFRDGDCLYTWDGRHVGTFVEKEVYGLDGWYMGEVRDDDRLITKTSLTSRRHIPTWARGSRGSIGSFGNRGSRGMLGGYEDFPSPDEIDE